METLEELKAAISALQAEVAAVMNDVNAEVSQDVAVVNAISFSTAAPLSVAGAVAEGSRGATIDWPVYFKSGQSAVSAVQFDVILAPGLTATSAVPGIAAQAANKSVQGSPVPGGFRVLVFGLNQTAIPSGPIAIVRVAISQDAPLGKSVTQLMNVSASNPSGANVAVATKSGSVAVR